MKRALVVDDSRSARVSLKKLLEGHGLEVAEATSGEAAIDFLRRDSVDVIFMDHTMPGMDGLEAVSAIKANPQTATIPVMMYTTKEGEVYVGQARALGAVGVLPKTIQPHQLFEMLLSLGLVQDRRGNRPVSQTLAAAVDDVDRALENQAMGMSVQALVTRILEDQHLTLRADILRTQKTFARQVAHEILREQDTSDSQADASDLGSGAGGVTRNGWSWPVVIAFAAAFVCLFQAWHFKSQRDAAVTQLRAAQTAPAPSRPAAAALPLVTERSDGDNVNSLLDPALAGFAQLLSDESQASMSAPAFGAELAARLRGLQPHLQRLGFNGVLSLTSHLGRFCLVVAADGSYQLAPDALPAEECDYRGHVLEDSDAVAARVAPEFAEWLQSQDLSGLTLSLQALTLADSVSLYPYPTDAVTAGVWNQAARANNRVSVSFR